MALQPIINLQLGSTPLYGGYPGNITMNASGRSLSVIGRIRFPNQATSKLVSSAGAAILWYAQGANVFTTVGTTMRLGIMDVDLATGLEDGSFDVYKEFVGGTDTVPAASLLTTPMTAGSKVLSDGDLIAIGVKMIARAGSDAVGVVSAATSNGPLPTPNLGFPIGGVNVGALARSQVQFLWCLLTTDDGTLGWIEGMPPLPFLSIANLTAFGLNTTPDEYANTFVAPFKMQISGMGVSMAGVAAGDLFDLILYADPLTSPVTLATVSFDPDVTAQTAGNNGLHLAALPTPITLTAGRTYGIAVRPTTAGTVIMGYQNLAAASGTTAQATLIKSACFLGPSLKVASRTDLTGAFVEVAPTAFPLFLLDVCGLEDGIGGGEVSAPF
jgi:hypothetical protein